MEALTTVCMATYNGERHVAAQLASILQSPRVGEVLVSDDGSTDRTREFVLGFADPRVRLLDGPRAGVTHNFEALLGAARGEYIFLADQDDVWLPHKVETMLAALQTADLVVSDCTVVDEDLRVLQPSFQAIRHSGPGLWKNLARNSYLGCCMAFRRRVLTHALPFPRQLPMHDWWIGLVADCIGTVRFLPEPLLQYRRHGGNASSTSERSTATLARQIAWRATLAIHLLGRCVAATPGRRP